MSMQKHITLVCDNKGCCAQVHTGMERNVEARFFASKTYDWATAPDYPPGGGGKHVDLCPACKYTWIRPGTSAPLFTILKPHEIEAMQEYQRAAPHQPSEDGEAGGAS